MADEEKAEPAAPSLVLIDPDPISRNAGEDLEDDLDQPVFALDSMDFDPETSEEVADADAFVICWDLGFRAGADLVEEIRQNELLADRVVLVASDSPTRSLVRRAFLSGADGVCTLPYDAEEVAQRLELARTRRAS